MRAHFCTVLAMSLALAGVNQMHAAGFAIGFAQPVVYVAEGQTQPFLALVREGDLTGECRVDVKVAGGIALAGADFVLDPTVAFSAGEATAFVGLAIPADAAEPTETFELALDLASLPPGAVPGTAAASVRILSSPLVLSWRPPGSAASSLQGAEDGPPFEARLYRRGPVEVAQHIRVRSVDGTAMAGIDFEPVDEVLEFAAGVTELPVLIRPINDSLVRGRRTFRLVTEGASPEVIQQSLPGQSVVIEDNERGYEIQLGNGSLDENSGQLQGVIVRQGDFDVASAVNYRAVPSRVFSPAAIAGRDFTPVSGVATFAPGETRWEFSVPILDDREPDGGRYVRVELFDPVGGVPLATAAAEAFIGDDDLGYGPGDPYDELTGWITIREREGPVVLHVLRQGDFDLTSAVRYEVVPGPGDSDFPTAVSGRDFEPTQGTLTFEPGQTSAEFPVVLHWNRSSSEDRHLVVRLSKPTGGVPIQTQEWSVLIRDAEAVPARVDPDFNPASVATPLPGDFDWVGRPVFPQADGRMVTVMDAEYLGVDGSMAVVRLLADGTIDPAFEPTPRAQAWSATPEGVCHVLTEDGRLFRLSPSGAPDPTFSFSTTNRESVQSVVSRPDGGAWIVARDDTWLFTPKRLGQDGQPDPAFRGTSFTSSVFRRMVALPSGGFALMGRELTTGGSEKLGGLVRCEADGTLVRPANPEPRALDVVQAEPLPDGRFLAIGYLPALKDFALFRATATGGIDDSFAPVPGIFVLTADTTALWLLRAQWSTGQHRIERRLLDGTTDPSWAAQTVTCDLRSAWQDWFGSGCGVGDFGWGWDWPDLWRWADSLPSLTADGHGGLFLGSVVRANGHLRRGLVRLDVAAPAERLDVAPTDARLGEDAGATFITIHRSGDLAAPGSHRWATADGTARAGIDYQTGAGRIEFAAGVREAVLPLVVLDNDRLDGDRTLRIEVRDAADVLLPPMVLTIVNDEFGFLPSGIVAFPGRPMLLRPTGHLTRRGVGGGVRIVGSPVLPVAGNAEVVAWADPFQPETVARPSDGPVQFLSVQPRDRDGRW